MVCKLIDKKTGIYGVIIKSVDVTNHQLAHEINKPIS